MKAVDANDLGHGVHGADELGRPATREWPYEPIAGRSPGVLPGCDEELGCFSEEACRERCRCMGTLDDDEWTELIMGTNPVP